MQWLMLILINLVFKPVEVKSIAEMRERGLSEGIVGRLYTVYPNLDSLPGDSTLYTIGILNAEELLIYLKCFQKDKISATVKKDDQDEILNDDYVLIILDTEGKGATAYGFVANAIGTRKDLMFTEAGNDAVEWDGKWSVEVSKENHGYEIVFRIPLNTISFTKNPWGIKVGRFIAAKSELQMSKTEGAIQSISNIDRIDVDFDKIITSEKEEIVALRPMLYARASKENLLGAENESFTYGGTFRFKKGASTVLDLVMNPDFSEIEADIREISYSRRPIFYPEKRELFMEGADLISMPVKILRTRYFENIKFGAKFYTRASRINSIFFVIEDEVFDTVAFGKINFTPFHGHKVGLNYIYSSQNFGAASLDVNGEIFPEYGLGFSSQYSYRIDEKSNLFYFKLYRRSEFKGLDASISIMRVGDDFIMPITPLYDNGVYEISGSLEYGIPFMSNAYVKPRFYYYSDRDLHTDTLVDRFYNLSVSGGKGPIAMELAYRNQDMYYLTGMDMEDKNYRFYSLALSFSKGSYNSVALQGMWGRYLGEASQSYGLHLKLSPLSKFNMGLKLETLKAGSWSEIFQIYGLIPVFKDVFILKPYVGYERMEGSEVLSYKTVGYLYLSKILAVLFVGDGSLSKESGTWEIVDKRISTKICINL
ncbi:MAG: hypothetical protein ACPLRV_02850 [Candidatus Hydrothermia bacterium]